MKSYKECELGTEIQSLIFSKDNFSEKKAKKWAERNDFVYGFVDEKENTFRIRQQEPNEFQEGSLRTIELTDGVKAVIGCPVEKMDNGGGVETPISYANGGDVNEDKTRVAKEIVNQLGGMNRLYITTGAYNFIAMPNGVSFRIKNPKANYIKITLTSMDLYDLEVGRIRGNTYKIVEKKDGLYSDMLKQAIEKATGMRLSFDDGGSTDDYKQSLQIITEKAENEVLYLKELKYDLENKRIRPAKIIGTGFKPQYARKLAFEYLENRIKEEEANYNYYKNLLKDLEEGKNIFLYEVDGKKVIKEKIEGDYIQVKYINGMTGTFKLDSFEEKKTYHAPVPENKFENGGNVLFGGKSDYMSLEDIAEKHNVPLSLIQKQYLIGIKIEKEHTNNSKIASEIAKDHLFEFPTYYTNLVNMETYLDKMYALGGRVSDEDDDGMWIEVFDAEEYNFIREFLVNNGIRYLEVPASNVNRKRIVLSEEKDFDKAVIFLNDYIKNKEIQQINFTPPQNMADLKRVMNVGFKLKVVYHRVPKEIGSLREVAIKQTNAVAFKDLTNPNRDLIWLEYPKASSVEFGEKGFTIYFKDDPTTKLVQYEYYMDSPDNMLENEEEVVFEMFDTDEEKYMGKRMMSYLNDLK